MLLKYSQIKKEIITNVGQIRSKSYHPFVWKGVCNKWKCFLLSYALKHIINSVQHQDPDENGELIQVHLSFVDPSY